MRADFDSETPAASGDAAGDAIFHADKDQPHVDAATTVQREAPREDDTVHRREKRAFAGSWSADDDDRPRWDAKTKLTGEFDYHYADGRYSLTKLKGVNGDGEKVFLTGRRTTGGVGGLQFEKQTNPDDFYRQHEISSYLKGKGDEPDLLYRLAELQREARARPDDPIFITEGEKDANSLSAMNLIATTNPDGALKWKAQFNDWFSDRNVVVMIDNDHNGRKRGKMIAVAPSTLGDCRCASKYTNDA